MFNYTESNSRTWKSLKYLRSPKVLAKASSAQTNLANEQASFYQTLTDAYKEEFANQGAILMSMDKAWQPILNAGINQYGFSPQEDTSMRTQASDTIANNTAAAQTALNENLAARGGGNTFTPSGATSQLEASLLSSEATQQSATANQITQAGYATGRNNFLAASGALSGVAQQYNPLGYAGVSTGAGTSAFNSATTVNQENTAWEGALTGSLVGLGEAALGDPMGLVTAAQSLGGGGGNNNGVGAFGPTSGSTNPGTAYS
jgi:hypothetical protein